MSYDYELESNNVKQNKLLRTIETKNQLDNKL